jgi:hypothetical protein
MTVSMHIMRRASHCVVIVKLLLELVGTLDMVGPGLYELSNLEVNFQSYVNAGDVAT